MDLEEKRRREDREHELRMLQMMGQMFQGSHHSAYTPQFEPFNSNDY